jgi:SAM-dependent methyltransferase
VGSGPGAFVALLRWAGLDATGLELSPWVVDYSRRTFDVPVLAGPVEDQEIEHQSLDAIVMMDVLEHLPDPVGTMRRCLRLLKREGVLIVQTPRLPHGKSYQRLVDDADPFLEMLKADEHLHLFSDQSVRRFFSELGVNEVVFEPAIFAHYDMFIIASRVPLMTHDRPAIETALQARPPGRLTLALLDLDDRLQEYERRLMESEADRAARLSAMEKLGAQLLESEADRAARLSSIETLQAQLLESEADRAARLDAVNDLGLRLAAKNEELNQARRELMQASNGELHANG